jgi:hypothetical protein
MSDVVVPVTDPTTAPAPVASAATDVAPSEKTKKVLAFKQVEDQFHKIYIGDEQNNSAILDMIAVYLKGQKFLYTEAKTLCEQRLNALMLPAIFNTAACTILSLVLKDISYGSTIVSCLNGCNAFLLAVISYLKLDARAEAHRTSAYKFDKLQSGLVFSSGRVLFGAMDQTKIVELIDKTEKEVQEIKESNQFILPELIRFTLPTLYNTNVFAEVKTIMNQETTELNILKDIVNDRSLIEEELLIAKENNDTVMIAAKQKAYDELTKEYRTKIKLCIKMRDTYTKLDKAMDAELQEIARRRRFTPQLCGCLKN